MTPKTLAVAITIVAAIAPGQPASAHGGSEADLTSDYRTRITEVPDIDGLAARTVGLDGTIEITWAGPGTLIVAGYEGEPYLRFDGTGVTANTRSPAAYLNQDRYANIELPDAADASADPDWQPVSSNNTYRWHDHRTHWMSPAPPPQAQQEPDRSHIIDDRWEIPLAIDGRDTVLAGNLTWAPAPPLLPWLGLALLIAVIATLAFWSPLWRAAAAAIAAIGTIALIIDTVGFVTLINDSLSNKAWAFVYPLVALVATMRLAVHARRRTPDPTLTMMIAGLVLTFIGGFDRFDVVTSGFYDSALDVTIARVLTVACLGIGAALVTRFLGFLIPYLKRVPTTSPVAGAPPTQITQDTGLERQARRATK